MWLKRLKRGLTQSEVLFVVLTVVSDQTDTPQVEIMSENFEVLMK